MAKEHEITLHLKIILPLIKCLMSILKNTKLNGGHCAFSETIWKLG